MFSKNSSSIFCVDFLLKKVLNKSSTEGFHILGEFAGPSQVHCPEIEK